MAANNVKKEDLIPLSDDDDSLEESRLSLGHDAEAKEAFVLYNGPKIKARHAKFLDFALKDSWTLYESLCEDTNPDGDESFKNAVLMQLELDPPTIAASDKHYVVEPRGNGYFTLEFVSKDGSALRGYRFCVPSAEVVMQRLTHHWQLSPTTRDTTQNQRVDSAVRNVYHEFRRQLVPPGILCRLLLPSIIVAFDRPAAIRFTRVHIVHDAFTHTFGKKCSALGVYLPSEFGIKDKVEAQTRYYKPLEKCAAEERRRFARDDRDFVFPFKPYERKMPTLLMSRLKCCPKVSEEMTQFFDFAVGTTVDRYEAAIRARVEGSDFVFWRNQVDTSDAFGNLIRQRRAYKELSEAADRDEEDDMLATIRPDDARPLVGNKLASALRKDKHVCQKIRVQRALQSRTMRLTRMDATRAPAANATATQGILQNVARFDGAQAAPGPSILKKATKLTVIVGKDVEDDCSTNVLSTPKRRPEALPTEKQLGVRLKPGPSNDDLRAQLAESKAQIEELKQQMELLDARHASERASEQRTAEQNLNCIVDQVQEQSRKQEKELIEQLSAKDTEIAGLNAKLKQQSVQWQTIYERNNGLEKANADLLAEVTELRRQNEDQSQKLASMAEDAEEAQETLKQMSDQLFARNDELGEKVSSLEAKCASFESDLCESKAEKDTLKETTEKLELERASVLRDELQREVAIAARLDDVAKS